MKNQSLKIVGTGPETSRPVPPQPERAGGFPPGSVRSVEAVTASSNLRMYKEEEVSAILQISLSQLRKWRMNARKNQGPPFKKVGRSVRYPERGLIEFVNGQ